MAEHDTDETPEISTSSEIRIVPSVLISGYWAVLNSSGVIGVVRSKPEAEMFGRSVIEKDAQEANSGPEKDKSTASDD